MRLQPATVVSNEPAFAGAFTMWLHSPSLSARREPGQFVMLHCSSDRHDPMFARAFSYHRVEGERFAILYAVVGRGTRWLASLQPGAVLYGYGPLGRGLRLPREPANVLLIGGGIGISPLVDAAYEALAARHQVLVLMGARRRDALLPPTALPPEVEYRLVTEDGSAGLAGKVTDHLEGPVEWASRIYACGPNQMFATLAEALRNNGRRQRPQILMEERMPCGWGLCYGCAIPTRRGVKLCCADGPRFNLFDVF